MPGSLNLETDYHDHPINLTLAEDSIVTRLLRNGGRVVPTKAFLHIHTGEPLARNHLAVAVRQLRIKLQDEEIVFNGKPTRRFIHTLFGAGYKFDPVEFRES